MKCRYLIDVREDRPQYWDHEGVVQREDGVHVWPAGTEEEHPNAWKRVRMGDSEPADDECRLRAAMSTKDMENAQRHNGALQKGIESKDYQRFFDGEILGYDENGDDIPGPNWIQRDEDDDSDDDDD